MTYTGITQQSEVNISYQYSTLEHPSMWFPNTRTNIRLGKLILGLTNGVPVLNKNSVSEVIWVKGDIVQFTEGQVIILHDYSIR